MTWNFGADPSVQLDRVRILIGDTDTTDQLISDEEIGMYLTGGYWAASSDHMAASYVANNLAAKFARRADSISAGGTSVNWSGLADRYRTLATELAARGSEAGLSAAPYAGGISIGDVLTRELDTDRVAPMFKRGDSRPLAPRTTEVYR